jgi:siroheme synthase
LQGKIYIIGTGPGDPELVTWKGLKIIRKADVVLLNLWTPPELLNEVREDATIYDWREEPAFQKLEQSWQKVTPDDNDNSKDTFWESIKEAFAKYDKYRIDAALSGKLVADLILGTPAIFERTFWKVEEYKKLDIPYEIVPGLSAALSVPTLAGIPLTYMHKDENGGKSYATLAVVPGMDKSRKGQSFELDWKSVAKMDTVVFMVSEKNVHKICSKMIEAGRSPDVPMAVIERGSLSDQKTTVGTLAKVPDSDKDLKVPALLVIGETVSYKI